MKIKRQDRMQQAIQDLSGISYPEWCLVKRYVDLQFSNEAHKHANECTLMVSNEMMENLKKSPLSE